MRTTKRAIYRSRAVRVGYARRLEQFDRHTMIEAIGDRFNELDADVDCRNRSTDAVRLAVTQFVCEYFAECPAIFVYEGGWASVVIQPAPQRDRRVRFDFTDAGARSCCKTLDTDDDDRCTLFGRMSADDIRGVIAWANHEGELPGCF